jgi:hypothetical protein
MIRRDKPRADLVVASYVLAELPEDGKCDGEALWMLRQQRLGADRARHAGAVSPASVRARAR